MIEPAGPVGIVVDSNSQLPAELADRYAIEVVPLTVTVDGLDHLEGIDLDADAFYAAWTGAQAPEVATSQPSPGAFVAAYSRLIDRGCASILSIHIAGSMSGTVNSARLAADLVGVPVEVVDSGTASFGIACCAWAAAETLEAGATVSRAVAVVGERSRALHSSFVIGVPRLMTRSGRAAGVDVEGAAAGSVAVLAMTGADLSVLDTVHDLDQAVAVMAADALAWPASDPRGLRIAIGTSDGSSRPMSEALTETLTAHPSVAAVVQYRIGPSVGAHTGPGTSGLFVF